MDPKADFDEVTEFHDPLVMRAKARVGQVLKEKWRLDVLLGVGGMAAVYAATHRNGSRVAIKILHPELSTNHQVSTRFSREGYVANAVGHDGAVRVSDDDVADDGSAFFVMELLDGETLEDRRVRCGGQLNEDEVLWLADQLLDVLAAAHSKGVIHRDLKPDNVFITRTGQVKVLDFGIARLREATSKSAATQSGATMGTPAFMSPEQARALWDEVDGRSDLWAVGATMFNLLTGGAVHEGRTTNEQLLHAMTKEAPPLEKVMPNITPAVCYVVNRALSFEKDRRWRDAVRMQEALRTAYYDRFGKPITTSPRLVVPASVPNRTLAGSLAAPVVPRLPTTGQPVAAGRNAATIPGRLSGRHLAALVLAGGAALSLTVTVAAVWLASSMHKRGASSFASAPTVPSAPSNVVESGPPVSPSTVASSATTAAADPSGPPVVAATDLPVVSAPIPPISAPVAGSGPSSAGRTESSARSTPTAATPAKRSCNPPYTIEPRTGAKHFKAECL